MNIALDNNFEFVILNLLQTLHISKCFSSFIQYIFITSNCKRSWGYNCGENRCDRMRDYISDHISDKDLAFGMYKELI